LQAPDFTPGFYTGTNYHIFWSNQHPNNVKNKKLKLDKWEYLIFKSWVNGETPMCLFVPFLLVILFSGLAASNYPFGISKLSSILVFN
jgi:hypothetical protein